MPVFFQQQINENTRLGIWKIEETEDFFKGNVPVHRDVTHPHKRLQHLAGRFLLQFLFPGFPYELIQIADTRKPFLPGEEFHFSISHCGDYAAAIVSKGNRVGIDIEIPVQKIGNIRNKFLSIDELEMFNVRIPTVINSNGQPTTALNVDLLTNLWTCKEAIFKWYGDGGVDFRDHIHLLKRNKDAETMECSFVKNENQTSLTVHYRDLEHLMLAWVLT